MKRLAWYAAVFCMGTLILQAATVTSITGKPERLKAGGEMWIALARGAVVANGDTIRCDARSSITITMQNNHRIQCGPKSQVSLVNIDQEETGVTLMLGRVRAWVKKLKTNQKFAVKTPVAVCSVRGTDFSMEYGETGQVRVEVYEGQVAALEETTGSEVLVNKGEFTQVTQNQPPQEPRAIPERSTPEEQGAAAIINETKEEARQEIFQEISREAVLSRSAEEIKLAEYQNGKALVDAFGNRVRLEEYIVRTQPNEFKYVVLNTREERFDFGKMIFTFNTTLPDDLTLATRTMFYAESVEKPAWWLTDVLSVMSNTVDQVNEEAAGGQMFADNAANPRSWKLGFQSYTFSVNNKNWWNYTDTNTNGLIESGEITYYDLNGSGTAITSITSELTQPSGSTAFHFHARNDYASGQWITADDYIIDDNGNILTLSDLHDKTSAELEEKAYASNFERVYEASVFNGRKIDLVFSGKLLIDAGILNLPNPGSIRE